MTYTDKQIQVFTGVLALARQGVDMASLRVQQIADAAGLGKGTLYEYFSSKEEILAGTVHWSLTQILNRLDRIMAEPGSFEAHVAGMLRALRDTMLGDATVYHSLSNGMRGEKPACCRFTEAQQDLLDRLLGLERALIAQGREEGVIRADLPEDYCRCVVETALMVSAAAVQGPAGSPVQAENLCRMVCRALA